MTKMSHVLFVLYILYDIYNIYYSYYIYYVSKIKGLEELSGLRNRAILMGLRGLSTEMYGFVRRCEYGLWQFFTWFYGFVRIDDCPPDVVER